MKKWITHTAILIALLLAGQAAAQAPVLDSVCAGAVRHYRVDGETGSTYSWILTPPAGPAITLPSDADTAEIAWNYPEGIYELVCVQHGENGCDADAVHGEVYVFDQPLVDAGPDGMICAGFYFKLIQATAEDCRSVIWATNGDGTFNDSTYINATYTPGPEDIDAGSVLLKLTGYGIVEDGGCEPSYSDMELRIVLEIVPQFEPIGPLCQYTVPPALPDTSLEGFQGTWSPPIINTDFLGTFPYTFDPDDPSGCAVDTTIMITITDLIVPTFDPIGPLCINSTAPALPDTSLEGITGDWDPPLISTDSAGIFTFTFNPNDSTQCGIETTMDVAVVTEIVPEFEPIGPLCQFSLPPDLPDSSLNGIAGTWNPLTIITDVPGIYDFTFTPYPDQCGKDTSIAIIILPQVIPVFDSIGPLCQYSVAPALPDTSLNGVTGNWNPAWINTSAPGVFTYTFTPDDPLQCGVVVSINIIIIPEIMPSFEPIGPLCQYSTPPILPDTSLEGLNGTWTPPVINTNTIGTFFFTFTPESYYPCVLELTIAISVVSEIIPEFDPIGPLCQYSIAPALPDTSLNGITGDWDPPLINTETEGTFTFTFTPDNPGQCGVVTTLDITIATQITPEFEPIAALCQYSVPPSLPGTSLNGITGYWDPAVITTDVPGTFTYMFTPDDPEQCGTAVTLDIAIIPEIIPVFDPIGPLCQFSIPPVLPDTSLNGVTGTWEPDTIDVTLPGTITYLFIADTGLCAGNISMDITVAGIPLVNQVESASTHCSQQIGQIIITAVSPDGSDLLYSIDDGSTYMANNTFNGLAAGLYWIRVKDLNGCEATYDFNPVILNDIPGPTVHFVAITNEVNSQHDGSIEISATGNTPNLFYSINNGNTWATNTGLFENLSEGTYYCLVKDDAGCDTSFIAEVGNTIIPLTYLTAITGEGDHCLGNAAIVPLEVDKFSDVALFQLKLSYNADNLQCEGYINVHPQIADRLVCWADQLAGEITLQWDDAPPVTFTGKTTILELVFTTKHSGQGQLEWYTNPTISFFADLQGISIPAEFYTGILNIYDPPVILIADAKNACEGDKVSIIGAASTTYPPLVYQWTYPDGQISFTDPVFDSVTQYQSGDYTLLVTDSMGCSDQKSIRLVVSDNPLAAFHGADTLRVPLNYILEAGTGLSYYLWNTGAETESIVIQASGMYSVEMISNVGCYGIDSVYVLILTEESPLECLFVPNAFTPDGDGLNDVFKAVSMCELSFYRMQIYNRWGEKLYETGDISTGWDGKKDGLVLPGDVYVYKISYKEAGAPADAMNTIKAGSVIIVK